ncbi:MAG: acyltransferase family protein [Burkholderiales bacterium]
MGQTGVGIFCALSGYLAFRGDQSRPWQWLKRRLEQLFPAYWVVTIAGFALTWLVGGKQISWSLFISQMLGTGYFTHGWALVNVVSWFISLILLCYLLAAVAKHSHRAQMVLGVAALISGGLLLAKAEVDLSRHVFTFALAGIIAIRGVTQLATVALVGILFTLALVASAQFAYAALSLSFLGVGLAWQAPASVMIRLASGYTYEFFLVHGLFLVAFTRLMPTPVIVSILLAVFVAAVAAFFLRPFARMLASTLSKRIRAMPPRV